MEHKKTKKNAGNRWGAFCRHRISTNTNQVNELLY